MALGANEKLCRGAATLPDGCAMSSHNELIADSLDTCQECGATNNKAAASTGGSGRVTQRERDAAFVPTNLMPG